MARVHYAKMGPKMQQSMKSEPGESPEAQPRLLQVLHGLQKTSTSPPGRRTQAIWDLEHPDISDIGISVSGLESYWDFMSCCVPEKTMKLAQPPAPNPSLPQLLVLASLGLPPMTSWLRVHNISQCATVLPTSAPVVMVPTCFQNN